MFSLKSPKDFWRFRKAVFAVDAFMFCFANGRAWKRPPWTRVVSRLHMWTYDHLLTCTRRYHQTLHDIDEQGYLMAEKRVLRVFNKHFVGVEPEEYSGNEFVLQTMHLGRALVTILHTCVVDCGHQKHTFGCYVAYFGGAAHTLVYNAVVNLRKFGVAFDPYKCTLKRYQNGGHVLWHATWEDTEQEIRLQAYIDTFCEH